MKKTTEALQWRYATQEFDPEKKLSADQLQVLKDALRFAPSSLGLQPWHFIVVENPEVREKLRSAGYNQPKITEASHLIVLAAEKNVDEALKEKFLNNIVEQGGGSREDLAGLEGMVNGAIQGRSLEAREEWVARQVYIALGMLLMAAAVEGIDAGPMEGFDPAKYDEILGLTEKGLSTKVIVAVGFRKETDPAAARQKIRYPETTVFSLV